MIELMHILLLLKISVKCQWESIEVYIVVDYKRESIEALYSS